MELEKKDCAKLTEDVLFEEILPRLDVETLIRLKLVSKRWLHLITADSRFISNHLRRQSQTPAVLSILVPDRSDNMYVIDHESGTSRARDIPSLCADRFHSSYSSIALVGSCNGLVCVALRSVSPEKDDREASVLLWNPGTGEARDTLLPAVAWNRNLVYGFGYDDRHDDYKVVRAMHARSEYDVDPYDPPTSVVNFDVFSRNSGVWRRLERRLEGHGVCCRAGIFVNGCLYWLLVLTEPIYILSFDLRSDEFRVIHTGISWDYTIHEPTQLVKWNRDCLACLKYHSSKPEFDFKLGLVLDAHGNVVDQGANRTSEPLFSSGSITSRSLYGVSHGRFFVEQCRYFPHLNSSGIIMYDYRHFGTQGSLLCADWGFKGRGCFDNGEVHDYVPTLVSVYQDRNMTAAMMEG